MVAHTYNPNCSGGSQIGDQPGQLGRYLKVKKKKSWGSSSVEMHLWVQSLVPLPQYLPHTPKKTLQKDGWYSVGIPPKTMVIICSCFISCFCDHQLDPCTYTNISFALAHQVQFPYYLFITFLSLGVLVWFGSSKF